MEPFWAAEAAAIQAAVDAVVPDQASAIANAVSTSAGGNHDCHQLPEHYAEHDAKPRQLQRITNFEDSRTDACTDDSHAGDT
jgi:hypothetical protein